MLFFTIIFDFNEQTLLDNTKGIMEMFIPIKTGIFRNTATTGRRRNTAMAVGRMSPSLQVQAVGTMESFQIALQPSRHPVATTALFQTVQDRVPPAIVGRNRRVNNAPRDSVNQAVVAGVEIVLAAVDGGAAVKIASVVAVLVGDLADLEGVAAAGFTVEDGRSNSACSYWACCFKNH